MTAERTETEHAAGRTCNQCGAVASMEARFCQSCGTRIVEEVQRAAAPIAARGAAAATATAADDDYDRRESQKLARELFKEHMALIESTAERVLALDGDVEDLEVSVRTAGARRFSDDRTKELQKAIEAVEALGDRWDELQHDYNRESESLDEGFVDRAAEMEIDFELPPDRSEKIEAAMGRLNESMAAVEARIHALAGLADGFLRQPGGRWFAGAKAGISSEWLSALLVLATAVQAFLIRDSDQSLGRMALILLVPWVAFGVSALVARRS